MIVEFFGTPGAGKSTLIREVAAATGGAVVDMVSGHDARGRQPGRQARRVQWAWSLVTNPRLGGFWWRSIRRDKAIVRHALEASRRDWLVRRMEGRPGLWLVDEGPLHRLLWVLAWSGWDEEVRPLTRHAADRLVFVATSPEVAFDRMTRRGGSNTVLDLPQRERLEALRRYHRLAAMLADEANAVCALEADEVVRNLESRP